MKRITSFPIMLLAVLAACGIIQANASEAAMSEKATFGAGCFWGVEETFRTLEGVIDTRVGFMGGTKENPTYRDVCSKTTGHAEVVEVTYEPSRISYEELLEVFFDTHDPTQVNRQGPDYGDQYRSAIFYHTEEQRRLAEAAKDGLNKSMKFRKPVATEITPAGTFWTAEEYHQKYLYKRGTKACGTR